MTEMLLTAAYVCVVWVGRFNMIDETLSVSRVTTPAYIVCYGISSYAKYDRIIATDSPLQVLALHHLWAVGFTLPSASLKTPSSSLAEFRASAGYQMGTPSLMIHRFKPMMWGRAVCRILNTIIALVWHSFSSEKCRIIILVFFFWRGLTLSSFLSLQDPLDEGYAEGNSDEHYRLEGKLSQYILLTSDFLFCIKQFYYFSPWI